MSVLLRHHHPERDVCESARPFYSCVLPRRPHRGSFRRPSARRSGGAVVENVRRTRTENGVLKCRKAGHSDWHTTVIPSPVKASSSVFIDLPEKIVQARFSTRETLKANKKKKTSSRFVIARAPQVKSNDVVSGIVVQCRR